MFLSSQQVKKDYTRYRHSEFQVLNEVPQAAHEAAFGVPSATAMPQ